jgi:hypothetical protein
MNTAEMKVYKSEVRDTYVTLYVTPHTNRPAEEILKCMLRKRIKSYCMLALPHVANIHLH